MRLFGVKKAERRAETAAPKLLMPCGCNSGLPTATSDSFLVFMRPKSYFSFVCKSKCSTRRRKHETAYFDTFSLISSSKTVRSAWAMACQIRQTNMPCAPPWTS